VGWGVSKKTSQETNPKLTTGETRAAREVNRRGGGGNKENGLQGGGEGTMRNKELGKPSFLFLRDDRHNPPGRGAAKSRGRPGGEKKVDANQAISTQKRPAKEKSMIDLKKIRKGSPRVE